ncbi:hypothetical protein [Williamsoniiplasma lucivorax]|uniref:Uncharacterized protein n=1 Tax=Williamsoniiplasma lucivorax TaxID=209274 RepID=A0A2S5RER5_9MOLU|nr:hypothetical protein [Williamsoniiplasma lucivorax]PPE05787.1 hypothetical protein ELUCI_v1c00750 [Williamsoniiplasma lucivorax]
MSYIWAKILGIVAANLIVGAVVYLYRSYKNKNRAPFMTTIYEENKKNWRMTAKYTIQIPIHNIQEQFNFSFPLSDFENVQFWLQKQALQYDEYYFFLEIIENAAMQFQTKWEEYEEGFSAILLMYPVEDGLPINVTPTPETNLSLKYHKLFLDIMTQNTILFFVQETLPLILGQVLIKKNHFSKSDILEKIIIENLQKFVVTMDIEYQKNL